MSSIPWVEKYRPRALDEVAHHKEIVQALQNAVSTDRLPHLLLYGPPGTGKTSVALALCRELWSPANFSRRVLELNSSDERGISVVRDKIKHFASLAIGDSAPVTTASFFTTSKTAKVGVTSEKVEKQYPNPPYKIIILDEADTMTSDAQSALRRIIEAHSKVTRFILICNYVTRIIEPLASRCAKFRFQPLPPIQMKERLRFIADQEGCVFKGADMDSDQVEKERELVFDAILDLSHGDMRRAVTALQSAHTLTGMGAFGPIELENIEEMAGVPPNSIILDLVKSLRSNSFQTMETSAQNIIAEGYPVPSIISMLFDCVVKDMVLSDLSKAEICIKIAESDKHLVDGANELLQLMSVCCLAMQCYARDASSSETAAGVC